MAGHGGAELDASWRGLATSRLWRTEGRVGCGVVEVEVEARGELNRDGVTMNNEWRGSRSVEVGSQRYGSRHQYLHQIQVPVNPGSGLTLTDERGRRAGVNRVLNTHVRAIAFARSRRRHVCILPPAAGAQTVPAALVRSPGPRLDACTLPGVWRPSWPCD